jgi:hypothetical protein
MRELKNSQANIVKPPPHSAAVCRLVVQAAATGLDLV